MPEEDKLLDLADFFRIFGDSTRIGILYSLMKDEGNGMCVTDIAEAMKATQSAVSHQLRTLKDNDLVRTRREGKQIYYSLADGHIKTILNMGMEHICEKN